MEQNKPAEPTAVFAQTSRMRYLWIFPEGKLHVQRVKEGSDHGVKFRASLGSVEAIMTASFKTAVIADECFDKTKQEPVARERLIDLQSTISRFIQ